MKIKLPKILLLFFTFFILATAISQTVLRTTISSFHSSMSNDSLQVVAGQILSAQTNNPKILHGYYPLNYSLLTLNEDIASKITVFPNPFESQFTISISSGNSIINSITVYNINGKLIHSSTYNLSKITVDLNDFVSGIYFVSFVDNKKKVTIQKLIKL